MTDETEKEIKEVLVETLQRLDRNTLQILKELDKRSQALLLFEAINDALKNVYDPNFGDLKLCVCGHPYYRHFDSYDSMSPSGCKYCDSEECVGFQLKVINVSACIECDGTGREDGLECPFCDGHGVKELRK